MLYVAPIIGYKSYFRLLAGASAEMGVRGLVLEDDPTDALAMRRELADRFEVILAETLADALIRLTAPGRAPDVIVTDLNLPDSTGPRTLEILRETAPGIPIVVSTGHLSATVRRQLDLLGAAHLHDKNDGFPILRALLQHTESFHQTMAMHRSQMRGEIDRVARAAAEEATRKAIDHSSSGSACTTRKGSGWRCGWRAAGTPPRRGSRPPSPPASAAPSSWRSVPASSPSCATRDE
jgi:CheY-like chemotaxis protein